MKKDQQSQQVNVALPLGPKPVSVAITILANARATVPAKSAEPEIAKFFALHTDPARRRIGPKDGAAFVYAKLNGPRSNANVAAVSALALDFDDDGAVDRVANLLRAAGLAGVVFSTWSSNSEAPRCRAVIPYSEPVPGETHRIVAKFITARYGADGACVDPARLNYAPASPSAEAAATACTVVVEGLALDGVALATQLAAQSPAPLAGGAARKKLNVDLDYTPDFPKVSAHAVADGCPQIAQFRKTGYAGKDHFGAWCAAVGTVKHTVEGPPLAHEWSAQAPEYSYAETQRKLDEMHNEGPARCETFTRFNPSGCQGCKFAGKITTPLHVVSTATTANSNTGDDPSNTRAKFRQQFALVPVAADVLVYDSESHIRTALMRVSTFKTRYGNEFIDGKPAPEVWLRDPQRTTVAGVDCFPGALPPGFVNTWRGLALEPKAGDVTPYLNFVRDVACSGNSTVSDYVVRYMAHMVQKPAELPETALVMTGPEGIGKGAFTAPLLEFVGDDASFIGTRAGQIAGQFNSQIQGALLVVANEVCFAGRVEDSGSLKALITENRIAYEEKGVPVRTGRNFARVIVSTNAKLAVEASAESRRFVVLDFSAAKKQDFQFFGSLAQWRENGGAAALLHHLLNIDLNGWHPRQIPTTKSLRGQRLEFLKRSDIVAAWWLGCLEAGCIDDGVTVTDGWPEEISARALEASLARDAGRHSQRWADAVKRLAKLTPEGFKRVDRTRQHSRFIGYTLPKLEACITAFEVATGTELERAA